LIGGFIRVEYAEFWDDGAEGGKNSPEKKNPDIRRRTALTEVIVAANRSAILVCDKGGPLDYWYTDAGGPLGVWRDWANDVTGRPIKGGHFFPEHNPRETALELRAFFGA
jgi:hypothetical protein